MNSLAKTKQAWSRLGYGMFIHFGVNTFAGTGWGDGTFPAEAFRPEGAAPEQWADVAAKAGMKYAVLTAKHHDGFCLWPSKHTGYSVKASGVPDLVRSFAGAFRARGLKVGLYYSLWDRNCACYEDDAKYADYMKFQLEELLTGYGDILELWFDGGWDKDSPAKDWSREPAPDEEPDGRRWFWKELYAHIHRIQPECLVIQNSSSNRPGRVRYLPADVRTSEHYHFIFEEKECVPPADGIVIDPDSGEPLELPIEFCTTLTPDWFWKAGACYSHPSAACIADWRLQAARMGGNLLLNIGPDAKGRIPACHQPFLTEARELFEKNAPEAIRPQAHAAASSENPLTQRNRL
ncbi:hypothetical protein SDC9_108911 [bioreactor metagenome]|uniref:alpha-L-fucosidase n=1 Tax=bioreactor metagenome TaxID=1076179 RepID=A0A645B9D8_9ZZZZ